MRAFCLPPVWRGSTYVPEPDVRDEPRATRGDLADELREHALRERVGLDLVRLDQRTETRLIADVAADRAAHQPGQAELREAAVGEVADADDADRRQVAWPAFGGEHRRQLIDEALRDGMAGPGTTDEHACCRRGPVRPRPERPDDLAHGM